MTKRLLMTILCLLMLSKTSFSGMWNAIFLQSHSVKVSWYGEEFHGRPTASGVIYNMNLRHLAHRTLPFGTVVLFFSTIRKTFSWGVVVDRGPFVKGRSYDLSRFMARELGIEHEGVAVIWSWVVRLGPGKSISG